MEKIYTLQTLPLIVEALWQQYATYSFWAFFAPMGSGKTTLMAALGQYLQFTTPVQSPTFALVQNYEDKAHHQYLHCDFYRLKNVQEIVDLGFFEWIEDKKTHCFVEWPEKLADFLPFPRVEITIEILDAFTRKLTTSIVVQS